MQSLEYILAYSTTNKKLGLALLSTDSNYGLFSLFEKELKEITKKYIYGKTSQESQIHK